jgi:hypothetical protein
MSQSSTPPEGLKGGEAPRDEAFWAKGRNVLRVSEVLAGAVNLNVDGQRVVEAPQGFGQLWQKTPGTLGRDRDDAGRGRIWFSKLSSEWFRFPRPSPTSVAEVLIRK